MTGSKIARVARCLFSVHTFCDSVKIKHLHLIRWEVVGTSQDCALVLHSTWDRVIAAKVCVGVSVTIGIVSNFNLVSTTKCWATTWVPVNGFGWVFHSAFKWLQAFFVVEWKYERIGSETITTTGRCQINKTRKTKIRDAVIHIRKQWTLELLNRGKWHERRGFVRLLGVAVFNWF